MEVSGALIFLTVPTCHHPHRCRLYPYWRPVYHSIFSAGKIQGGKMQMFIARREDSPSPPGRRFARLRWLSGKVLCACLAAGLLLLSASSHSQENRCNRDPFSQFHRRFIGLIGTRTAAVVGEPEDPLVAYVGAATGGIWKTENAGTNWKPILDREGVAAIRALAIAPS
jgi:hypothetical protein